ncbi:MAG: hypothetical protein PHH85_09735 [Candidatus Methanoperedens sp.]|nr:hypothetical protein [Candidatus Methanoperedens sp.]
MTNETFNFSPRVELILANLKTVRNIKHALDEDGQENFKKFLEHINNELNKRLPELQSWKYEICTNKYMGIYYYLGDDWKVIKDDYICIFVELAYNSEILDDDDPWVGLYVPQPEDWKQSKKFTEELNKKLPKGFIKYWEKPDSDALLWQWVKFEDYEKEGYFDTSGFVDKVEELVSKLVKIKDIINSSIKKVRR